MKTYGTLRRHAIEGEWARDRSGEMRQRPPRPGWCATVEPHVAIWLKRVLPQISSRQSKNLTFPDTPALCRDALWILDRFPLHLAPEDERHLHARAAIQLEREQAVQQVLDVAYTPPTFELAIPPREYQRVAADLALRTGGLLLADDVGLGKTIVGIAMLSDPRALPAIVVTLTHLPRQWGRELARFAPKLRVMIPRAGTPGKREEQELAGLTPPDVVVLNYHKLDGWTPYLLGRNTVVFDEVQELRHDSSIKYSRAREISAAATFRIGLSATPIYNFGGEMFNVLNVLRPDELGSFAEFSREWCGGHSPTDTDGDGYVRQTPGKASVTNPKAFGLFLRDRGIMLRRTRHDVGRELPALTKITHEVDADEATLHAVEGAATALARIILRQGGERNEKFKASEELSWRLRQATGIAKAPYVAEFVRMLVENGERVLLYGWHREVYGIWRERLHDLNPVLFTGTESPVQKDASRDAFMSGKAKVLIMSLRAGAGLDGLQKACRTVVFGELDWSPGVHEQNIGRVQRDGQPDPVVAYFLVCDSGSDPSVVDALGLKTGQVEGIRTPDGSLVEELQVDPGRVRKLAVAYLAQRGIQVDEPASTEGVA